MSVEKGQGGQPAADSSGAERSGAERRGQRKRHGQNGERTAQRNERGVGAAGAVDNNGTSIGNETVTAAGWKWREEWAMGREGGKRRRKRAWKACCAGMGVAWLMMLVCVCAPFTRTHISQAGTIPPGSTAAPKRVLCTALREPERPWRPGFYEFVRALRVIPDVAFVCLICGMYGIASRMGTLECPASFGAYIRKHVCGANFLSCRGLCGKPYVRNAGS